MSEHLAPKDSPHHCFVSGVIKVDYKLAGWPDLMKVAREWANDPNFYEIIVRSVSETNFGIQFTYYSSNGVPKGKSRELIDDVAKRFGKVYAFDVSEVTSNCDDRSVTDGVVVLKALSA